MRLICPNCSAQYEIDVTLIPDEGRDVQCSNCGHTWFELPPPAADFEGAPPELDEMAADTLEAAEDDFSEAAESDDAPEDADTPEYADTEDDDDDAPSQAAKAMAAASDDADEDEDAEEFYADEAHDEEHVQRRPADAAALGILREEAERELSQRRAPPSTEPIETQTDLGLDEIRDRKTPTRALRARMAHLDDEKPEADEAETTDIGSRPSSQAEVVSDADYQAPRRDLLPDIDEINSTLKSTRKRADEGTGAVASHRSGFRTGFILMLLLTAGLILSYAQAPAIARAFPASETAILTYVDKANGVRDWIDGVLGGN